MRAVIAELSELSPVLMEKFIAAGKLPNFKRFRDEAEVFTTESGDDGLEPWIQGVTFHTGVLLSEHGIESLGDGHKLEDEIVTLDGAEVPDYMRSRPLESLTRASA